MGTTEGAFGRGAGLVEDANQIDYDVRACDGSGQGFGVVHIDLDHPHIR